ncbi:class I SAM-dependent methyltransferase [Peptoanaerobacter stomatis]|uniref:class I SAM-dependent methyltransferase n=1 Tax=Peptoanaerobacter stomatis TaxID=796937 RepID=UPI003F9FE355
MFWDKVARFYDIFEKLYNGEVNCKLVIVVSNMVESGDRILECACGTGMLSKGIALRCKELIATDFSDGMLKQTKKNCKHMNNVKIRKADIMSLNFKDGEFDKVVAGNVIHLLDFPYEALTELIRVCKNGGKVIIPTYVNNENVGKTNLFVSLLKNLGADFKKQFDFKSYIEFFKTAGYIENVEYILIDGKMPCAIAIITKIG